ncbi:MAG: phage Gp37/Gp68 family protein [Chloroflexota bacterium]|nr:phage Gp37/Gp68 family protein [Chloroflexota bacterium]
MAVSSKIEWTEVTWNPVTGCTKISPGCKYCYAERLAKRLQAMGSHKYQTGFEVALHPEVLDQPARWRKPRYVFVNSMSDLFHQAVPTEYVQAVFNIMNEHPRHKFQILTKRPARVRRLDRKVDWTPNIWLGVSIESERWADRLTYLKESGAAVKFLSLEPLLGPLPKLDLSGIDWVIVGGESGPGARPLHPEWVREIRDNCVGNDVPFFFKQWGGTFKKRTGRMLDGRTWDEIPKSPS